MKELTRKRLGELSVEGGESIISVFKRMDTQDVRLLCVMEKGAYRGIVSAGDIQRAIIANRGLDTPVGKVLREEIRVAHSEDTFESVKSMMLQFRTEFMPVLNEAGDLADVYFWDEVFHSEGPQAEQIDVPVVVMAGGKGTRLKPFSNILPKPLFPLGDKTMIEEILDRFQASGCRRFFLSLNHKAEFIRNYLDQLDGDPYDLTYFEEDQPLGTAGSLRLVRGEIDETFFVSNCDIVVNTDYSEILSYHREHHNEITLVGALKHIQIPYGTIEAGEGGSLIGFQEKPEFTYLINAGLYLLEPHLFSDVPERGMFHLTDLIDLVRKRDGKVGVFPVSEKSWCDIGEWAEYGRTLGILGAGTNPWE